LRWLLLPLWALQVFSQERSFLSNPILSSLWLNKRGFAVWRARLALQMTQWRRRRLEHLINAADRHGFERDGYVAKRDFLSPEEFAALANEVKELRTQAREFKDGDSITRRIALTSKALKHLPACRRLLQHPEFRGLTRYVSSFDSDPFVFVQTIFTQVDGSEPDPLRLMHSDTFHPTMKAWLFLEDVAEEDGPFTIVPGSHSRTTRREVWERRRSVQACDTGSGRKRNPYLISDAEMAQLRCAAPKRFAVPANTLVVADTHGFHARQRSTRPSVRVEFWAYTRRSPFPPWVRFDPDSLKFWRGRGAEVGWMLVALRRRLGLRTPKFRQVTGVGPTTPPTPWEVSTLAS
jgi:hypothetical protein